MHCTVNRAIGISLLLILLGGCSGVRSYSRSTPTPLADAYACAVRQLKEMGYTLELEDSVGTLAQARREITGFVERARRGAATATRVITVGLAGGASRRYDELTVFVYRRQYPQGNTIEATAGMVTLDGDTRERGSPTDAAKRDARTLLTTCAAR